MQASRKPKLSQKPSMVLAVLVGLAAIFAIFGIAGISRSPPQDVCVVNYRSCMSECDTLVSLRARVSCNSWCVAAYKDCAPSGIYVG